MNNVIKISHYFGSVLITLVTILIHKSYAAGRSEEHGHEISQLWLQDDLVVSFKEKQHQQGHARLKYNAFSGFL